MVAASPAWWRVRNGGERCEELPPQVQYLIDTLTAAEKRLDALNETLDHSFVAIARRVELSCVCGLSAQIWANVGWVEGLAFEHWKLLHQNCRTPEGLKDGAVTLRRL